RMRIDVEQGQAGPQPLVATETDPTREGSPGLGVRRVPDEDAFRPAGRPRGIDDRGWTQWFEHRWARRRLGRSHVDGIQVLLAQDDPRLEIVDEVLDLRLGEIGFGRQW